MELGRHGPPQQSKTARSAHERGIPNPLRHRPHRIPHRPHSNQPSMTRRRTHNPVSAARTEKVNAECQLHNSRKGVCGNGACGKKLSGKQSRWCSKKCATWFTLNHRWTNARKNAKTAATYYRCLHCEDFFRQVEVNHIAPCVGERGWSCHHHADNLEVLCKTCHLTVTNRQRKEGLI